MAKSPNNHLVVVRTWYGLKAAIEIESTHWHRAGFGRLLIPHPPVANWLLRRGLSETAYQHLCVEHELGHLQMLPFELLYAAILFSLLIKNGHTDLSDVTLILISCFALWEISAELYVMITKMFCYKSYYKGVSAVPRVLFWSVTIIFVSVGWIVALMR